MTRFTTTLALTFVLIGGSLVSAQSFPQIRYRFGMQVSLTGNGNAKGLYINSVNYGGPAASAGLQVGDVILSSNGQGFGYAYSDTQAVEILQASVSANSGGIPTATLASQSFTSETSVHLVIFRNGQQLSGTVCPVEVHGGVPTSPGFGNPPKYVTLPIHPPVTPPTCGGGHGSKPKGGVPTF